MDLNAQPQTQTVGAGSVAPVGNMMSETSPTSSTSRISPTDFIKQWLQPYTPSIRLTVTAYVAFAGIIGRTEYTTVDNVAAEVMTLLLAVSGLQEVEVVTIGTQLIEALNNEYK